MTRRDTTPNGQLGGSRYFITVEPLPKNGFIQTVELNGSPVKDRKPDLSGLNGVVRLKIVISLDGARISGKVDRHRS
jgi:hypothetical protein